MKNDKDYHHDPLMVPANSLLSTPKDTNQKDENLNPVHLQVTDSERIQIDKWLDRSLNPSLRGLLLDWVLSPEQKYTHKDDLFFEIYKKARSLNETRLPNRLPESKVKHIAESVTRSVKDGTAALKRNTHYKEDILKYRDPIAYKAEQQKAGYRSGAVRRGNAMEKWRAVMRDVRRGELSVTAIAKKHGIHRSTVYRIIGKIGETL